MTTFVGIDPSTKTGLVMMNKEGQAFYQQELIMDKGFFASDQQIKEYGEYIVSIIPEQAIICLEGFSFGSQGQGVSAQYGIGFAIRFELIRQGKMYLEVAPSQVKKFASGSGNTSKENLILPIYKRWNFEHDSDNVRDAYILARIAMSLQKGSELTKYQQEVMDNLLKPKEKVAAKKKSRKK